MLFPISSLHQQRFETIRKELNLLGTKEHNFVQVELLFYETLSISRAYGNDPSENKLLASLKGVLGEEYQKTKEHTKKAAQREHSIRKFVVKLKNVLAGRA